MLVHQNLMFIITRNCQLAHIITVFRIPETTAIICEPTIKNSVNELINMVMVYGISWTHLPSSSNWQNLLKNKHVLKSSNKACLQNYKIANNLLSVKEWDDIFPEHVLLNSGYQSQRKVLHLPFLIYNWIRSLLWRQCDFLHCWQIKLVCGPFINS